MTEIRPAATVLYDSGNPPEALLADFAQGLKGRGVRVAGLLQFTHRGPDGRKTGMELVELDSGIRHDIAQNLGRGAGSCLVDSGAVTGSTEALRRALAQRAEVVFVNKFSHLEKAGDGLAQEILQVMAEGLPLVIAVSSAMLDDWREFCGGLCRILPQDEPALWGWWSEMGMDGAGRGPR